MNYFAFLLKCKELYKKINGASKLSYKSSNTRSSFLLSKANSFFHTGIV